MQHAETNIVGVFLVRSKAAPLQARFAPQHWASFCAFCAFFHLRLSFAFYAFFRELFHNWVASHTDIDILSIASINLISIFNWNPREPSRIEGCSSVAQNRFICAID